MINKLLGSLLFATVSCVPPRPQTTVYDVVIRGGTIYDGLGGAPFVGDIGIIGDRIRLTGNFGALNARREIDARGMAVAPGFINMLSWANESLIQDGRSQGDIRQGVTLEVMGEGSSMGPLTDSMRTFGGSSGGLRTARPTCSPRKPTRLRSTASTA